MKLYSYDSFNEKNYFTDITNKAKKAHIYALCIKYMITLPFTINDDMSISVPHDVDLENKSDGGFILGGSSVGSKNLTQIPIKFRQVDGDFRCSKNKLFSLKNSPSIINGSFHAMNNNLNSLIGGPKYVDGFYNVYNNNIFSFEGFPENFIGRVEFGLNPANEILHLFTSRNTTDKYRIINLINEYDVIQNREIIKDRLDMVFESLNLEVPETLDIKNYKVL